MASVLSRDFSQTQVLYCTRSNGFIVRCRLESYTWGTIGCLAGQYLCLCCLRPSALRPITPPPGALLERDCGSLLWRKLPGESGLLRFACFSSNITHFDLETRLFRCFGPAFHQYGTGGRHLVVVFHFECYTNTGLRKRCNTRGRRMVDELKCRGRGTGIPGLWGASGICIYLFETSDIRQRRSCLDGSSGFFFCSAP